LKILKSFSNKIEDGIFIKLSENVILPLILEDSKIKNFKNNFFGTLTLGGKSNNFVFGKSGIDGHQHKKSISFHLLRPT
jgi:hypothetical protein